MKALSIKAVLTAVVLFFFGASTFGSDLTEFEKQKLKTQEQCYEMALKEKKNLVTFCAQSKPDLATYLALRDHFVVCYRGAEVNAFKQHGKCTVVAYNDGTSDLKWVKTLPGDFDKTVIIKPENLCASAGKWGGCCGTTPCTCGKCTCTNGQCKAAPQVQMPVQVQMPMMSGCSNGRCGMPVQMFPSFGGCQNGQCNR